MAERTQQRVSISVCAKAAAVAEVISHAKTSANDAHCETMTLLWGGFC